MHDPSMFDVTSFEPIQRHSAPHTIAQIEASWHRCRALGLEPHVRPSGTSRTGTTASVVLRRMLEDVAEQMDGTGVLVLVDAQATVLDLLGTDADICTLRHLGIGHGTVWSETHLGTNAIALALQLGQPCATIGSNHYCQALHSIAVAAAPLFDLAGGQIGAVATILTTTDYHPHVLALVAIAAQHLQTQLQLDDDQRTSNRRLTLLNTALETVSEGFALLDDDGIIAQVNQQFLQILGITERVRGRAITDMLNLPAPLQQALRLRQAMAEQELLFVSPAGAQAIVCSFKPIVRHDQFLGSLLLLHSHERVRQLVHELTGTHAHLSFNDMIGTSVRFEHARMQAQSAARSDANVLLVGEHGTGKDVVARAIHQSSPRSHAPFVALNCGTVPRTLIDIELFGADSTSAHQRSRPGKLELADGGTLLLTAIETLPMELQTALLRALDAGALIRIGGQRVVPLNVRIIAASVRELPVGEGLFRPDLATRLSVRTIELPPLRERDTDILLFANQLLTRFNEQFGKHLVLHPDALDALTSYPWPGNIRELEHVMERVVNQVEPGVIRRADLPTHVARWQHERGTSGLLVRQTDHVERAAIIRAGHATGGHLGRTAQQLGISRTTLWRKMRNLHIARPDLLA